MLGIGLQTGYNALQATNGNFYYYPFTGMQFGPNQPVANLPPEAGRDITPRGAYKSGIWGAGGFSVLPRISEDFGFLLLAALGLDTPLADVDLDGSTVAGCNVHEFTFAAAAANIPYFTARRVLQHSTEAEMLGEQIQDCHVGSLEVTIPAVGPVSANLDLLGRIPAALALLKPDPTTDWGLAAVTYDDDDAFALSVHDLSRVKLDIAGSRVELPATGVTFALNNNLLPPDQGRVIGDPTPVDYPVLSRSAMVRVTCLLEDYDLYRYIIANGIGIGDTGFSPTVYQGGLDIRAYSPLTFGTNTPYAIQFTTDDSPIATKDNISWSIQGAITIAPAQPIILNLVGQIQRPSSGAYVKVRLQNNVATAYTTP